MDIDEYCSVALSEVLIKLVDDFDPYTDKGFMNLYYYRIKKAFINLYKKELAQKRKALTTSIEWKGSFGDSYCTHINEEKGDIYKIIEDYAKINPKAKIMYLYEIENREIRTQEILPINRKKAKIYVILHKKVYFKKVYFKINFFYVTFHTKYLLIL